MMEFFKFVVGFFKPWRRKVGVVTLVMALALMSGWMRSLRSFDLINCPVLREYAIAVVSWEGAIAIRVGWDNEDSWNVFVWEEKEGDYYGYTDPNDEHGFYRFTQPIPDGSGCSVSWYLMGDSCGIGVTPFNQRSYRRMLFMIVPYGFITIPLTVVSVYLLLTKPKRSTPKKVIEPTTNEGATL